MVQRYCLQFRIVATEVHNHFRKPRLEIFDRIAIELFPCSRGNGGIGHHSGIKDEVFFGEQWEQFVRVTGEPRRQERQMVFVSDFDENCKKLRLCKKDAHVTVQMRRMNSRSDGSLDLCADLSLRLFRFDILRGRSSLWPQITGGSKRQSSQPA